MAERAAVGAFFKKEASGERKKPTAEPARRESDSLLPPFRFLFIQSLSDMRLTEWSKVKKFLSNLTSSLISFSLASLHPSLL